MRKLFLIFGIAYMAASCSPKKTYRYTHTIIVTYNDGKTESVTFHSSATKGDSYTETGCIIWLGNACLHVTGCEECDVTGISRCGVRSYDHHIDGKEEVK